MPFNNYNEMFLAYADLYRIGLFGAGGAGDDSQNNHKITTTTTKPGKLPPTPSAGGHCLSPSLAEAAFLVANHSQDDHSAAACNATISAEQQPVEMTCESQAHKILLEDPRLMLEDEGGRIVRLGSFNSLETGDLINIASIFLVLVLAKRLLTRQLTNLKRIDKLGLREKDRERIIECVWRLVYYSISSTWLIHCCLKHNSHLLLTSQPADKSALSYTFQIDWATYAIFMIEAAFYVHATYALIFEDVWRRDSPMMLAHHLAAVFTTLALYASRTQQIGLISTVLRDTCDVLLEVVKLTKCFHIQHGRRVWSLGVAVNCFLSLFALAFAVNQLYYFPLYCIYHGLNLIKVHNIQTPVMMGIMSCGLLFLLLDFLWFGLILRLLYYMALAKPMKDIREYDDEDDDIVESDESAPGSPTKSNNNNNNHRTTTTTQIAQSQPNHLEMTKKNL